MVVPGVVVEPLVVAFDTDPVVVVGPLVVVLDADPVVVVEPLVVVFDADPVVVELDAVVAGVVVELVDVVFDTDPVVVKLDAVVAGAVVDDPLVDVVFDAVELDVVLAGMVDDVKLDDVVPGAVVDVELTVMISVWLAPSVSQISRVTYRVALTPAQFRVSHVANCTTTPSCSTIMIEVVLSNGSAMHSRNVEAAAAKAVSLAHEFESNANKSKTGPALSWCMCLSSATVGASGSSK